MRNLIFGIIALFTINSLAVSDFSITDPGSTLIPQNYTDGGAQKFSNLSSAEEISIKNQTDGKIGVCYQQVQAAGCSDELTLDPGEALVWEDDISSSVFVRSRTGADITTGGELWIAVKR